MKDKMSVFLPVRKGSERIKDKNTKEFAGFSYGLLGLKLETLIKTKNVSKIFVSTNDSKCKRIAGHYKNKSNKIEIDERPDSLALSNTSLIDLVKYVPSIIKSEHILWTHVTSPFLNCEDYDQAIHEYFEALNNGYDSLMSVHPFRNFLWSDEKKDIVNRMNQERWPRTQDLVQLFEIDSGIFIAPREVYLEVNDRIGKNPFLFKTDKIKSFDIDWEEDFKLAEIIFQHHNNLIIK